MYAVHCRIQELIRIGHKWHVLSHETPDDVAAEASAWLNSANNSSQVTHEVEHIRCLQRVCLKELTASRTVVLASLVSKTMDQFKLKSPSSALLHLARWVTSQGPHVYVDHLCEFHSTEVNPNELTIPPSLFGEVANLLPRSATDVKLDLITLAYSTEQVLPKVRPQPDVADFIKVVVIIFVWVPVRRH